MAASLAGAQCSGKVLGDSIMHGEPDFTVKDTGKISEPNSTAGILLLRLMKLILTVSSEPSVQGLLFGILSHSLAAKNEFSCVVLEANPSRSLVYLNRL